MREENVSPKSYLRILSGMLLAGLAALLITVAAQAAAHDVEQHKDAAMQQSLHQEHAIAHYSITEGNAAAQHNAQSETFMAHIDMHFVDHLESEVVHLTMHGSDHVENEAAQVELSLEHAA